MSRWYIEALLGCLLIGHCNMASAQRCRSLQPGDFMTIANWDCGCNPLECDTLEVRHGMSLDSAVSLPMALVVVGEMGALVSTQPLDISARIENHGSITAPWVWFNGSDILINTGHIEGEVVLLVKDSVYNYGEVHGSDSLVLGYYRRCFNEGFMSGAFYYGLGVMFNSGTVDSDSSWTRLFLNFESGTIRVTDHWFAAGGFMNEGSIEVGSVEVVSGFENYGSIRCSGNFVNGSSFGGADSRLHEGSTLFAGGFINPIGAYFRGPGSLCVSGNSENHGFISAPISICDLTLLDPQLPFMDVNTGDFMQPIYYCTDPVCTAVNVPDLDAAHGMMVYPVPSIDALTIALPGGTASLVLFDATGRKVREVRGPFGAEVVLERNGSAAGVYSLQALSSEGILTGHAQAVFVDR